MVAPRVTSGHTAHPRSAGLGETPPRGPPRCPRSLPAFPPSTHASTHSRPAASACSGRASPESIFFPSLEAQGSRLHLNEELGARGDLHVSGLPEMEPPSARSGRRPRPRSPLHLFILLNKNINRVRRAPKRGGERGEAQLDRCEHLAAASISLKMAPLWSFPLPSPFFALPLTSRVGAPASYPVRPFLAPAPTWGAPATPKSKHRDQSQTGKEPLDY